MPEVESWRSLWRSKNTYAERAAFCHDLETKALAMETNLSDQEAKLVATLESALQQADTLTLSLVSIHVSGALDALFSAKGKLRALPKAGIQNN